MEEIVDDSTYRTPEAPSLSENDISILLGRALQKGEFLPMLDLRNCNDVDLRTMREMVAGEISVRLLGNYSMVRYPLERAELLTAQLQVEDRALTSRQIEVLAAIDRQLGDVMHSRVEEEIEARGSGKE